MTQSDERNSPMIPAMKPYEVLITVLVTVCSIDKGPNVRKDLVQGNISKLSNGCNAEVVQNGGVECVGKG